MFSPNCVVVLPASEIFLKSSAVRGFMLKKLQKNMILCLKHFDVEHGNFVSLAGRIIIPSNVPVKVVSSLKNCFGIFALSVAEEVEYSSLDVLCSTVVKIASGVLKSGTFAVRGKSFVKGVSSKQLEEALGRKMLDTSSALKVKLKNPEQEVYCILHKERAFIYFDSFEGAKGMPLSSQGKVALLITENSNPLDLEKTGKNLMKCGCSIVIVSDSRLVPLDYLVEYNCYRPLNLYSIDDAKALYSNGDLLAFFSTAKTLVQAEKDSKLVGTKVFAPLIVE